MTSRPHVIPDLLTKFKSRINVKQVLPFDDEIKLELVEHYTLAVKAIVTKQTNIAQRVDWLINRLVQQVNVQGNIIQFQRIIDQPVADDVHREILSSDGVCLRYTVKPIPDDCFEITLDCVCFESDTCGKKTNPGRTIEAEASS